METARDDVLARLETAIERWNSQIAEAHLGIAGQLAKVQDRVQALKTTLPQEPSVSSVLAQAQAETESLIQQVTQGKTELTQANTVIAQLREEVASLKAELSRIGHDTDAFAGLAEERRLELENVRAELAHAHEQFEAAQPVLDQVQILENLLENERGRIEYLEAQLQDRRQEEALREMANKLTAALRDREEAHQEIVAQRAEIAALQRANAALALPDPDKTGAETQTPLEIFDAEGRRMRIGEILLRLNMISEEQLKTALVEQEKQPHRRLGAILIENGYTSEEVVGRVLARQLELPFVRLTTGVIDEAAPRILNGQLARRRMCVPVTLSVDRIVLAMANPFDLVAMDDVELATGRRVDPVVTTPTDIMDALLRHYGIS